LYYTLRSGEAWEPIVDVTAWLRHLGLQQYEQAFRDHAIDGATLPTLGADDLKELGVAALGHRKRLLAAIAELSPDRGERLPADQVTGVPLEGERRQVTVLFCDLAGYTRLSRELDAEEVHDLLGRFFELADRLIESYGGTVDKHLGDCVMGVFGAPRAHDNDPERAALTALAIREAAPSVVDRFGRPLAVHIGIASGQVVASGTGSAGHREYTVTGESVNLASRLTDAAGTGAILISEEMHRVLPLRFARAEHGDLGVTGLSGPVRTWRLLGLSEADAAPRPFVGRLSELNQFAGVLGGCRDSGSGQTIYIRGEAGIGKTRLVEEFRRRAEAAEFAVHTGLILDFGTSTGQDAIRSVVRSLLELPLGASDEDRAAAVDQALAGGLVAADRRVFLNDLLDLGQPTDLRSLYDAMDNRTRNEGKRATVAELVGQASTNRPLLLVVEDVHWADRLTLEHLASLVRTVAECRALLVMTSRTEGDPLDQAWRSEVAGSPFITLDLGPLRLEEATALASAFMETREEFARRCLERAAGNPLFLEQLLRHAEESAEAGVPASIQSLVQARMDRLEPADKQALQAASVFGQRFSQEGLQHALDQPSYDCAGLIAHYLARPQGEHLLFAHALIRDAVYDSMLRTKRRALHLRAADWFAARDPVLYAEHFDRAEDPAAPGAYLRAARVQATEYRYESALRLVRRGLALAAEPGDVFELTCFEGDLLHDLGRVNESLTAFEKAAEFARDDGEQCRAWIGLASGMRVTDRTDEALSMLDLAEEVASRNELLLELTRAHHLRGNLLFPLGRIEECAEQHRLALDFARQAGSVREEAAALGGLGDASYARGRIVSAHDYFSRCIDLARVQGLGRIEVANLSMVAHCRMYLADLKGAREVGRVAIEAALAVGHQRAEVIARNAAGVLALLAGDLDEGKEHVERRLALARQLGAARFEAVALNDHAGILRAEGRIQEAVEALERALAISRAAGVSFVGPWILGQLGLVVDDPERRRAALQEGERILRSGAPAHNHFWFYTFAIETSLATGAWDEAERYAAALETYNSAEPTVWCEFLVAWGRALAAHGRGARDETTMSRLAGLRDQAAQIGFRFALPPLQAALAS
jgi:class 3 adenylate cyclase/tetratricopeptide (TPR) repeat protein